MSDYIEQEIIDTYKEHEFHQEIDEQCSECYKLIADKIIIKEDNA